jgi:hypothetical protein
MTNEKRDPKELVWEDPPGPRPKKGSQWDLVAEALKSNPGQWAKIVTQGQTAIKTDAEKGTLRCFRPAGSFEGRVKLMENERWVGDVWLRYVGEDQEYAEGDE